MQNVQFSRQAKNYLNRLSKLRTQDDCILIDEFWQSIKNHMLVGGYGGAAKEIIIAIPCHVREIGLYESLAAYSSAGIEKDCLIVVFLNATDSMDANEFQRLSADRLSDINKAIFNYPELSVVSIAHHFTRAVMVSRVRGLLCDAIIKVLLENDIADPLIISNDADALFYSKNYLANISKCFAENPQLDYVSGPVYWSGCDVDGRIHYSPKIPLPEVYLNDLFGIYADEIYREYGPVYSCGCNSAFRLASLCAVDAYNYEFAHFDVEIGRILNRFRKQQNENADLNQFARFVPESALVTNPRRAIHAQLSSIPFGQQFDTVGTILGADIDVDEYVKKYSRCSAFIQADDLRLYDDTANAKTKVQTRITATFLDFVNGEPISQKQSLSKMLAARLGLQIVSMNDGSLSSDPTQLKSISFNWTKDDLTARLVKWASSLPSQFAD